MRQKVVKEYIVRALLELLKQKELSKITVNELIHKAGVCRSSYYRNFFLLEDVIAKYLEALLDSLLKEEPLDVSAPRPHILKSYEILLSQREVLSTLEKRKLLYILDDAMYRVCTARMELLKIADGEYHAYFLAGASSFLMKAWIKNGFREPPEEMTEISLKLYFKKLDPTAYDLIHKG